MEELPQLDQYRVLIDSRVVSWAHVSRTPRRKRRSTTTWMGITLRLAHVPGISSTFACWVCRVFGIMGHSRNVFQKKKENKQLAAFKDPGTLF